MSSRGRDQAGRPRLLVVDDEADAREGLARIVAGWGYEVEAAASAEAALELVDEYRPDVVITDLVLPEMDGLKLLERMLQAARPPVVLLITGHASVETAVEAMRRGAADFLTKPVEVAQLQVRLEKAIERVAKYRWPGNVRELRNVMHRAVMLGGTGFLRPEHLPERLLGGTAAPAWIEDVPVTSLREMERLLIVEALDTFDFDKRRTAATLGISLKTLYNKLAKHGIPLAKPER